MSEYGTERPFEDVMIGDRVEVQSLAGVITRGPVMRLYNGPENEVRAQVQTGPNPKKDFGVGKILQEL